MKTKTFTVQQGSASTVKVFDAQTGSLYRIIATGGNIVSSPYVSGNIVAVTVEVGGKRFSKTFTLPHGGLQSTMPLN
jgi:hypothetical protein|tara:strand:- start:44 stop:274 length:231 start_codon:yes stop_codon:yes gene_type:complete